MKALALSAAYTVPTDGLYYPVVLMSTPFGTTQPSLMSGAGAGMSAPLAGKPRANWFQVGQTSLPTTATPADTSAAIWFAVS